MKAEGTVGAPTCFYMDILLFFASALSVHNLENQPDGGIGRSFRSFSVYDTESVTPYLTKNRARCISPWSYLFWHTMWCLQSTCLVMWLHDAHWPAWTKLKEYKLYRKLKAYLWYVKWVHWRKHIWSKKWCMRREFEFRTGRTRDNNETGCSNLDCSLEN
jgi:hypothetical protein